MKLLIALAGLHRVDRGAEVALEAIGAGLSAMGHDVTLAGSGRVDPSRPYGFTPVPTIARERFTRAPSLPLLREPSSYEALGFAARSTTLVDLADFDLTITCGYPWEHLRLRRFRSSSKRPPHVYITENGDWPALLDRGEARLFSCDGLVCTNPVYFDRNCDRWNAALIPNGVDIDRFSPGAADRQRLGLPVEAPIVLMASALIESKRVEVGIDVVASVDDAVLLVAGDGPLAESLDELGRAKLGDRYLRRTFGHGEMPSVYRSSDLLLHLSRFESFGNVYIEALATGLPVVAHRSEVTEWILGDRGQLVDSDDPRALHAQVAAQLQRGRDHGASERIELARQRYSWSAIAADYDRFLAPLARG